MSPPTTLLCRLSDALRSSALGIVTGNLVCLYVASAQRSSAPFGPVLENSLGFTPASLAVFPEPKGRPSLAVSCETLPEIRQYRLDDSGAITLHRRLKLSEPQRKVLPADIDNDGRMEFVCLSARTAELTIVKPTGETIAERRLSLDGDPRNLSVADITNDGRPDLLLFGRGLPGVVLMTGSGTGMLEPGPRLFPEISAADVQMLDLNGDRIKDVMLLDWLSNRLVLFFGINGRVFSEQVTVPLPGEPGKIAIVPGLRRRNYRVAVTLPEQRQVLLYAALASGEFILEQTIDCPGPPRTVLFADVDRDRIPDLIVGTDAGILVAVADRRGFLGKSYQLGAHAGEDLLQVVDVDGDGRPDLICADPDRGALVAIGNADGTGSFPWPPVYAVGAMPGGIALEDFNDDGRADIAVANRGSASISFLFNRGGGKFDGQRAVPVAEGPSQITSLATSGGAAHMLLVTHRPADAISVVQLAPELSRSTSLSIATDRSPYILSASQDGSPGRLSMLVRSSGDPGGSTSLSLFEQISEEQFVERRFRPSIPFRISALTVSSALSGREIVFVAGGKPLGIFSVPMAGAGGTLGMRSPRRLRDLPDSVQTIRNGIVRDVDGDGVPDCILVGNAPRPSVGVLLGRSDSTFGGDITWYPDLRPRGGEGMMLADMDMDRYVDLLLLDEAQNRILVLYGGPGGRFGRPVTVCDAAGVTAFAAASLVAGGRLDLVLSNTRRGTVSVLHDPFRR